MDLLYRVPHALVTPSDLLAHLRSPAWAKFVTRFAAPSIKELSPVAPAVLACLEREWRVPIAHVAAQLCVVCHGNFAPKFGSEDCAVRLPCGDDLHLQCARAWLRRRSSCPVCVAPLPRALEGKYALLKVHSELALDDVVGDAERCVRVVVTVELERAGESGGRECQLSASLTASTGEQFHDAVSGSGNRNQHRTSERLSVLQQPARIARLADRIATTTCLR
ncbi:hypothetical protein PybrP1_002626 [[Pythium] brassicae (nom. inval.)]|nr:hypothetical protein PybrP1_002626 [[Pythium] brassicae (nom. inval.)]